VKCSTCGKETAEDKIVRIDDEPVCVDCLFGEVTPFTIRPIGIVKNDKKRKKTGFGTTGGDISVIHLLPGMTRFMKGLSEETHLMIVWYIHNAGAVRTDFSRGWDGKRVGPFASRTPDRVTPIGVTDVELLEVDSDRLTVKGLDAVDGTPVLDIKVGMESLERTGRKNYS